MSSFIFSGVNILGLSVYKCNGQNYPPAAFYLEMTSLEHSDKTPTSRTTHLLSDMSDFSFDLFLPVALPYHSLVKLVSIGVYLAFSHLSLVILVSLFF